MLELSQGYSDDNKLEEEEESEENPPITNPKIALLQDSSHESFTSTLSEVADSLNEEDAPSFFKVILSHFDNTDLNVSIGHAILLIVRKLIHKSDIFSIFIKKKYLNSLPFNYPAYSDYVFAIVYDVLNLNPSPFTKVFCDQNHFLNSVHNDPRKALSIIIKYAQMYIDEQIQYPWPLLDILLTSANFFITTELIDAYISTLCCLCKGNEEYSKERLPKVYKVFTKYLLHSDNKCNSRLYLGLCHLLEMPCETTIEFELPYEALKNDLKNPEIQESAITFLYQFICSDPQHEKLFNIPELISSIFTAAADNSKATLILMILAEHHSELAEIILGDGNWLLHYLPQATDTFRLFLCIFEHNHLRSTIMKLKKFVPFLKFALKSMASAGILTIISTILRRIPIDAELASQLTKKGFIKLYMQTCIEHNDDNKVASHALLLLIDKLAPLGCCSDFIEAIPIVNNLLSDENLSEIASYVAIKLLDDPDCLQKMKEVGTVKFFKQHLKDDESKTLRHNSRKFLRKYKSLS